MKEIASREMVAVSYLSNEVLLNCGQLRARIKNGHGALIYSLIPSTLPASYLQERCAAFSNAKRHQAQSILSQDLCE